MSELELETQELRRRLESQTWEARMPTPGTLSMEPTVKTISPSLTNQSTSPPAMQLPVGDIVSPPAEETLDIKPLVIPGSTISRSLDGITVSAAVIDELYDIFFTDFQHVLPIFDPQVTPNQYYHRSQLLFWAIAGVACRKYAKDPTLLDSLGERVLNQALLSLRTPSIPIIKGLLLILTWPLPKAASSADATYAISGSVIHMAMQIGLHIPTSSQDFSRVKVNLTDRQILKRAELWGYCIVTYQRSCSFKGHSPLALLETYQDSEQRHTLFERISPSLKFQLRLNGVVTRCCSALLQNGLRMMTPEQAHALDVLIRVFEAMLKDIEPEATSGRQFGNFGNGTDIGADIDKFYLFVARLTVQAFHFYKEPSKKIPTFMITRMYTSAVAVLRHLDHLDNAGALKLGAAPFYCVYATSLASFTILRLLKASTANYMDENAKEDFFLGVNIMKRLSTENNDGPSRISMIMTQLWNSEKAFKNADGSEHLSLRIRTRLSMSPVFDCIWWWREEFGGQPGAYTGTQFQEETPKEPSESFRKYP